MPLSKDGSVHVTDEKFNSASHLVAAIAALTGWVVLVTLASVQGAPWKIVSFAIYGLSLFLLFFFSTLHHGLNGSEETDRRLRQADYNAIFLLIAGTLTPVVLVLSRTPLGWALLGECWFLAFLGIALKTAVPALPKWVTSVFYVCMGGMVTPLLGSVLPHLGLAGTLLLVLGGVFYLVGAVVFTAEKPNPIPGRFGFHEIWHILVMCGAASHYAMMLVAVLPA
jgi:hemolysin III